MIAFVCSGCGKSLKVKEELAGRKGKCPHCQQAMTVPSAAEAAGQGGSETDAKTILPESMDVNRDSKTILPAVPRGNPAPKKGNTVVPGVSAANGDAELYDFLAPPQETDEIGRLGSYRVLKVLGAGGMGVVFQAEDPRLRRLVALKAMLPALAASGSNKERFLLEARAAAAIEHDHIVSIFQVDEDRGVPFIAMPFLRGLSLEDRLKMDRKLPLPEALRIGKESAEGLAAAHERGMIHRDIKPANIWLEGDRGRVKILDFGLARSAQGESKLTQQGAIVGTPAYMAPEQGAGRPVDTRCDLFSLGCVLYRMTTGQLPFKGADTVSTLVAVATETPKAPRKLNPAISPRFSKLIVDLLAKDPKDRPPSALSVVDLLTEIEIEPAAESTQVIEEEPPPPRAKAVREEQDTIQQRGRRSDRDDWEEERPAKRSLMLPLLIGGGTGLVLLLLAGALAAVLYFKETPPEVVQNNNDANKPRPINTPKPFVPPNPIAPKENPKPADPPKVDGDNPAPKTPDNGNTGILKPKPRPKKEGEQEADKTFHPYSSPVKGLLFSPDGKQFYSFGESRIDCWDTATRKNIRNFSLNGAVRGFVLSADGSQILAYNENQLIAWDSDGGGTARAVTPLAGQKIIGGGFSTDKDFRVALAHRVELGRGIQRKTVGLVHIYDDALKNSPSKGFLLVDPTVKKNPQPIALPHENGEVLNAYFSPDGKKIITWCKDRTFRSWDLEAKRPLANFPVAPGDAKSIRVSTDFTRILASFAQAGVRVYEVEGGKEIQDFKPKGVGDTDSVAFGGDDKIGVTATFGGPTCIYDLEEATIKKSIKGIAFTTAIALSPDGKTLVCGDMGGKIYLYNLKE